MNTKGKLILLPVPITEEADFTTIPQVVLSAIETLEIFVVEEIKTARRILRKAGYTRNFDEVKFYILNEHTSETEIPEMLQELKSGKNVGMLSEAGLPCIADPGNPLVIAAHESKIQIIPLPGPSSLFQALMASGFNGQNFAFVGYLPIDKNQRNRKIKEIEILALKNDQTQIFIEAPYRNNAMFEALISTLQPYTHLCIACRIGEVDEFIQTHTVVDWKRQKPDLHKKNTVFLIYR